MLADYISRQQRRPVPALSVVLFVMGVALMAALRFGLFTDSIVNIGYGLPLLIGIWYPDRRLVFSLMGAFALMAAYQVFLVTPRIYQGVPFTVWGMQMLNMLVTGCAVLVVMELLKKLRWQTRELAESNQTLVSREAEISRQNKELQIQAQELVLQNDEIQKQSADIRRQSAEVQRINGELHQRQAILQALLASLKEGDSTDLPERICHLLLSLLGEDATAVVVLEKDGADMVVLAQAGPISLPTRRWPFDRSFAAVIMSTNRTACVPDLRMRADLEGVQTENSLFFRSVLAAPLRLAGKPTGVVKVYSNHPHQWTSEQFKLIEWMSAQCSLLMDSRRLQAELKNTNLDLDRLVKERTAELQGLVNELEHFSYTITHDLRAPLRAMNGFAGLLAEECMDSLNPSSREYLGRIITAAGRMDRLITDALSYSQVVRQEMALQPVDVGRLLAGMIDSYPIFQSPKAQIRIDPDLPPVLGNEAALTQCFSNLLGNAVKFVAPGVVPQVRIRAERRDGRVRLWCEDNGIGIPRELHGRVFVMFQRLSKQYEGTGIGLALVKKVVDRMGGDVGVDSEIGRGTRFWVELKPADSLAPSIESS